MRYSPENVRCQSRLLHHLPLRNVSPDRAVAGFSVVFEGYAEEAVNRPTPQRAHTRFLRADILQTC